MTVNDNPQSGPKPPLYAQIADVVRRSVESGRLEPGIVLLEGRLADVLGSSRAPVRQALSVLEQEGVVSRFDGRGCLVGNGSQVRRVVLRNDMFELDTLSLKKTFAWQSIYEEVESTAIHFSAFGAFRVNELEMARHFGVGRSVAHDVLTRIEGLGILARDDRQRWVTVTLDNRRVGHLYEVREVLEPLALGHALPVLERDMVAKYRDRAANLVSRYPDVDAATLDKLEIHLHKRCLERCPNKELIAALRRTRSVLTLSKHTLGVDMAMPAEDPFIAEHRDILGTILVGDGAEAPSLLREHLRKSRSRVLGRLDQLRATYSLPDCPYIS